MDKMDIKTTLLILGTIISFISAIIGSYLTYYFTVKSKKKEAILKFREEKYINLLIYLQGFVGNTASSEVKRKFLKNNTDLGYIVLME